MSAISMHDISPPFSVASGSKTRAASRRANSAKARAE